MIRRSNLVKDIFRAFVPAVVLAFSVSCFAADGPPNGTSPTPANSGLYVKVQLNHPVKLSKLMPGDVIEGTLARDVYSSDRKLFTSGSLVRMPVDHMEKRRRERNDHWPWVVNAFTPRHQPYPIFKIATISGSNGDRQLNVSLVSISRKREVRAQAKKPKNPQQAGEPAIVEVSKSGGLYASDKTTAPLMVLEAFRADESLQALDDTAGAMSGRGSSYGNAPELRSPDSATPDSSAMETLPVGTTCKILLLGNVSASKSRVGDPVQARLIEPVIVKSRVVLPAGSLIEGKVVKKTPPRWGSRAGSLSLAFTGVILPGGNSLPMTASLSGAELEQRSHTKIDAEGQLHGEHPGKAWMAINIGVTAGLAKEADDTFQLIVEAIVSTATDASTAGSARIVSSCVSGVFMVTRHGRDVILPRFTEMQISLDRPLSVTRASRSEPSAMLVHGN